jgi:hypothetical protein
MSGICSEHQHHEPNCMRCTALPMTCSEARIAKLEAVLRWFAENGDRATTSCPDKERGCRGSGRVEFSEYAAGQWCDCCRASAAIEDL